MPLFEFVCSQCGEVFEELVRSAGSMKGVVCPACASEDVKKKISTFASHASGSAGFSMAPASSCSTGST